MTEAERRDVLIERARKEFNVDMKPVNISEAFRIFAKAHPDEMHGVKLLITPREKDRPQTILDEYERPKCRKCGAALFWKAGCTACNGPVTKNHWVCTACGFKRITKDTLAQAMAKLKRKKEI